MQLGIYLAAAAVMTTKAGSAAEAASWAATGGRPLDHGNLTARSERRIQAHTGSRPTKGLKSIGDHN